MRILLGVCGGIAAYKACALTSTLVQRGDDVEVIMTEEARRFIAPLTFAALTRKHVATSLWDDTTAIAHIDLVRRAECFVIVPATANVIAKLALGLADDLLSTAALAARIPIILAPAMNSAMYEHAATREHLACLRSRGVIIVEPEDGFLAERESGVGRLAAQDSIITAIDASGSASLQRVAAYPGSDDAPQTHVLITAGPTREAIDPVRFISNGASGATGIALAREAYARGMRVSLILGPSSLAVPTGIEVLRVMSAAEMFAAALRIADASPRPQVVIATAAVADHRPRTISPQKLKKGRDTFDHIDLEPTQDIVAALRDALPHAYVVGFAAETEAHDEHARKKILAKHLDAVVLNDVSAGRAVGNVRNSVKAFFADGDLMSIVDQAKETIAQRLLDRIMQHAAVKHAVQDGAE